MVDKNDISISGTLKFAIAVLIPSGVQFEAERSGTFVSFSGNQVTAQVSKPNEGASASFVIARTSQFNRFSFDGNLVRTNYQGQMLLLEGVSAPHGSTLSLKGNQFGTPLWNGE